MHSNVTIKDVSWPHFSWPTLYNFHLRAICTCVRHFAYCSSNYYGGEKSEIWPRLSTQSLFSRLRFKTEHRI